MKACTLFLATIVFASMASAQTVSQEGKARELNSKNKPVSGVFIKFENAASTNSDDNGIFMLTFQEKQSGDIIFLEDIRKSGYELVNHKDFEVTTLSNSERLNKDMIFAKKGVIESAKKEYYGISDKALIASLEKEKNKLKSKLKASELDQQEYLSQLQSLQEQYDVQKKSLDELSEKFATTNFDDVEPIYLEALKLFKNGDIRNAISLLESKNNTQQTSKILKEESRIYSVQKELDTQKAELYEIKQKQIAAVSLLADMYSLNFNRLKAKEQYDQLIALDSTDLEILGKVAYFYKSQHFYEEAKITYKKIIAHPESKPWQKGNAHSHLGDLHTYTGSTEEALRSFEASYDFYTTLYTNTPTTFYKNGLARANMNIGLTYKTLGSLEKSLIALEEFKTLQEELLNESPDNKNFKRGLGVAYEKLGKTKSAMGDLKAALSHFIKRFNIIKSLTESDPENQELKNHYALANFFLGSTYMDLGDLPQALTYFTECLNLSNELVQEQPNNVEYKLNLGFANQSMGIMHSEMGDLKSALVFFKQYNLIEEEISQLYPLNVRYKNAHGVSLSYMGQTLYHMGQLKESLIYYEEEIKLFKDLHETDMANTEFTARLADAYKDKGWSYLYLKNFDESLISFKRYNELKQELFEAYPNNNNFKNLYAVSCQALGRVYTELEDYTNALKYSEIYNQILEELYKLFPEKVSFKNSLAISYEKLGHIYADLGNHKKAIHLYKKELKVFQELTKDHSTNVRYKNSLAITYAILGDFYKYDVEDNNKAIENYKAAEAILIDLIKEAPEYAKFKETLLMIQEELKN